MIDQSQYCNDVDCLFNFCQLVDLLVKNIMYLETEVVKTRYELSSHLKPPYSDHLRSDILSNLAGQYTDNTAYQIYIKLMYDNHDPMESDEHVRHLISLAYGTIE
jgi:hypothetical protein